MKKSKVLSVVSGLLVLSPLTLSLTSCFADSGINNNSPSLPPISSNTNTNTQGCGNSNVGVIQPDESNNGSSEQTTPDENASGPNNDVSEPTIPDENTGVPSEPNVNTDETLVDQAVNELTRMNIQIKSDKGNVNINQITKENIFEYINVNQKFDGDVIVKCQSIQKSGYDTLKVEFILEKNNYKRTVEKIISGFSFDASELNPSIINHDYIVNKAIDDFKQNPLTINELGKQTKIDSVNSTNIQQYVTNFPTSNGIASLEIKCEEVSKKDETTLDVVILFSSGNVSKRATSTVSGFKTEPKPVTPQNNNEIEQDNSGNNTGGGNAGNNESIAKPNPPIEMTNEEYVNKAIDKFNKKTLTIKNKNKKIILSDIRKHNVSNYVDGLPYEYDGGTQVAADVVEVKAINNNSISIKIKFSRNNRDEKTVEKTVSGFKILDPKNDIIELSEKIKNWNLSLNENGSKVNVKNVNSNNILEYIKDFNVIENYYDHFSVSASDLKKIGYDTIRFKIQIKIKNETKVIENKELSGFSFDATPIIGQNDIYPITPIDTPDERTAGVLGREKEIQNRQYELNGLENSIKRIEQELTQYPNKQVNILYDLESNAVLHKYGTISHLIKVSELTTKYNNLTVHLFIDNNEVQLVEDKFNFTSFKAKYPNVKIINTKDICVENQGLGYMNTYYTKNLDIINQYVAHNKFDNLKNNTNYIMVDDLKFLSKFAHGYETNISILDDFIKAYLPLLNFKEILILGDGTGSTAFYTDTIYTKYRSNNYLQFNRSTKSYTHAKKLLSELVWNYRKGHKNYLIKWLKEKSDNMDTFIGALLSGNIIPYNNGDDNNLSGESILYLPTTRYFHSSVNLVKDCNNDWSSQLDDNDKNDEYFDPYNTESLNIIDFFHTLSDESKTLFTNVLKLGSISSFESKFENHSNYIYGGALVNATQNSNENINNELLRRESARLISLYDDIHNEFTQANKDISKIKIWFKGHPRDNEYIKQGITDNISDILKNDNDKKQRIINAFDVLDHKIPLEYYVMSGLFTPNPSKNKEVKCQTGWSTFALAPLDSKDSKDIIWRIIISKDNSEIKGRFGFDPSKNDGKSICFPKEKIKIDN